MLRRLLSLLLITGLLLGGGPACCVPGVAVAAGDDASAASNADAPSSGGCHEAPLVATDTPTPDSAEGSPDGSAGECQRCSHCLASASPAVSPRLAIFAAPAADAGLLILPDGLPPLAPALRPPISPVLVHAT